MTSTLTIVRQMGVETDRYRAVLLSLRCDLKLIRDSSFSSVRDAALRMLMLIEAELTAEPQVQPVSVDPSAISSSLLLREIARRMQQIRHVRKLCFRCKNKPARARGLCVKCYKKAYRRGEIKRET